MLTLLSFFLQRCKPEEGQSKNSSYTHSILFLEQSLINMKMHLSSAFWNDLVYLFSRSNSNNLNQLFNFLSIIVWNEGNGYAPSNVSLSVPSFFSITNDGVPWSPEEIAKALSLSAKDLYLVPSRHALNSSLFRPSNCMDNFFKLSELAHPVFSPP